MTQTKGRRKTACTKTAVSGIKNENLRVCWRKQVPDRPDRILFVDQGRGRSFAVYYVTENYETDPAPKKHRYSQIDSCELSPLMQMQLDEYAEANALQKCSPETYATIQSVFRKGASR